MRNVSQTLFLRMISDALSRDWMQADKASWDKPWKTALWKNTKSQNKANRKMDWMEERKWTTKHHLWEINETYIYTSVKFRKTDQRPSHGGVPHAMQISWRDWRLQARCFCISYINHRKKNEEQTPPWPCVEIKSAGVTSWKCGPGLLLLLAVGSSSWMSEKEHSCDFICSSFRLWAILYRCFKKGRKDKCLNRWKDPKASQNLPTGNVTVNARRQPHSLSCKIFQIYEENIRLFKKNICWLQLKLHQWRLTKHLSSIIVILLQASWH